MKPSPSESKTPGDLEQVKKRLKAGKIKPEDLAVLEDLVKRTEEATKLLRAAVVE